MISECGAIIFFLGHNFFLFPDLFARLLRRCSPSSTPFLKFLFLRFLFFFPENPPDCRESAPASVSASLSLSVNPKANQMEKKAGPNPPPPFFMPPSFSYFSYLPLPVFFQGFLFFLRPIPFSSLTKISPPPFCRRPQTHSQGDYHCFLWKIWT